MKRISINSVSPPDLNSIHTELKRWNVLLGNGKKYSFSNKKDLTYCLAETNRQLNIIAFELNELWISSFTEFRRIWYYMTPSTLTSEEAIISSGNRDIAKYFGMLIERSAWENGSVSAFRWIYLISEILKDQFGIFIRIRRARKQFLESRCLEMKIRLIDRMLYDMDNIDVSPKFGNVTEKEASFRYDGSR